MSWNIQKPSEYINGPLTVAGVTQINNNLGLGVTPTERFDVQTTSGRFKIRAYGGASVKIDSSAAMGYNVATGNGHIFQINDVDVATLNSTGLGIGISPSDRLTVNGAATFSGFGINANPINFSGTGQSFARFRNFGADFYFGVEGGTDGAFFPSSTAYSAVLYNANNTPLHFYTNSALRATIDNSGRFLLANSVSGSAGNWWLQVKNTASSSNAVYFENLSGNDRAIVFCKHDWATGATTGTMVAFANGGGTLVGTITSTNTGTAYNTSSDYRLKNDVKPLTGALDRVNALKPSVYKWISNGSSGEGFIAHELAAVVPMAVTGEKDAVNEDGTIKAQAVDLSRVVPILVAAIQELTSRVVTLENA